MSSTHSIASNAILSPADFVKREGISPRTAKRWRQNGEGPPFIRIGRRRVGYPLTAVEAWEAQRTFAHRADEVAQTILAAQAAE